MAKDLRSILNASGLSLTDTEETQRVHVELTTGGASDQTLEKLRACGLQIDDTVGNKISGSIQGKNRKALESLDEVAGVEPAVQLNPHSGTRGA